MLFEEHHFIFIKLFRTKSHSGNIMALGVPLWLLSEQITLQHTVNFNVNNVIAILKL